MTVRSTYSNLQFASLMALAVLFIQCSKDAEDNGSIGIFQIVNPIVTDTVYTTDYVAAIHSIQNVEIRARVGGYLDKIHADEGQMVRKGQLLFSIAGQEYREELAQAKAMLKSAIAEAKTLELDLRNTKSLVEKNIVSATELELAQSKLDAANAIIEEAKAHESGANLQLSFTEIRAPFDGLIDRFPKKAGSLINEGDLLTSISDSKEVFAYFNFSESDYLDHTLSNQNSNGTEVQLVLANNTIYTFKGKIETVEGRINSGTGNIAFRARFPNPQGIIKHGSSGKIRIQRKLENAVLIPQKSTFEIQGNIYVFLVNKENNVQMRKIIPSYTLPHLYVISSGLLPEEEFIYEGIQRVREGDKVEKEIVQANWK